MSDVVIQVDSLSKKYDLGVIGSGTLKHDLNRWWSRVRGRGDPHAPIDAAHKPSSNGTNGTNGFAAHSTEEIWALRDVSFEVKQGEILGIIGRNGAGKSTLLKILSRTTAPTAGEVRVKGRIASLLEVGTGFHPDLTGRENVFLNGAILGMTHREIRHKFDEIVAFSEVERFIDTPVKRYSSGMYVRLAFAVAAHLEPEILIVDEVLAVGDAEFQKKCIGKMQDVSSGGRTVLFVSHNLPAVRTLCTQGIVLDHGRLAYSGTAQASVDAYLAAGSERTTERRWEKGQQPGDDVLKLRSLAVAPDSPSAEFCTLDREILVHVEYEVLRFHPRVCVSIHLLTQGVCAFVGGNASTPHEPGIYRSIARIPANLLNNVNYFVTVFLITDTTQLRVIEREAVQFEVHEIAARGEFVGEMMGIVRPSMNWELLPIGQDQQVLV